MERSESRIYGAKQETTLSMIEDCLDHIYTVRKRALKHKQVKNNQNIQQRKQELEGSALHSPLVQVRGRPLHMADPEDDEDDKDRHELVKEMSVKLKTPSAIAPAPPAPKALHAKGASKKTPLDAQTLLDDFLKVFNVMVDEAEDDDELDDDCDMLTEKYFTNGLDLLPAGPEVSAAKKKISALIEDLASGDLEKHRRAKAAERTVVVVDEEGVRKKAVTFKDPTPVSSPTAPAPEAPVNQEALTQVSSKSVDKGAAEKARIKAQYESYMKMKRRSDQVKDSKEKEKDAQKIREYEQLNDDIKNILQTMQPATAEP